jgi:CheY-like chemotaxis protein
VPRLSVLVVDDVELVRRLIRRQLELADHRVYEAGDGFEALACLAANPSVELVITDLRMPNMDGLELVITDLRMPNMDGWELATRLSQRSPRLPVLFMSGFDEHLASDTVMGRVLPKPFTPEQLDERIRQVLGAKRTDRPA